MLFFDESFLCHVNCIEALFNMYSKVAVVLQETTISRSNRPRNMEEIPPFFVSGHSILD